MARTPGGAGKRAAGRLSLALLVATSLPIAGGALAEGFSIDAASPSVVSGSSSAILVPGPVGGPPTVDTAAASLGLAGGSTDEVDAISFGAGAPGLTFHFSVDRASVGLAGDVVTEAAAGQAAGDVFATDLMGGNRLVSNQRSLGLAPASLPGTPSPGPIDDLDGLDLAYPGGGGGQIVVVLAPGHPLMGSGLGCGGDLFFAGTLFLGYAGLGLGSCLDDVDALEVDTTSYTFYYSLAPGSPSLAPGSPIAGCGAGCSPADIFSVQFGAGPAALFAPASALGLRATDDVDALALGPAPPPLPSPVPSLGESGMLLAAILLLAGAYTAADRRGRAKVGEIRAGVSAPGSR